MSKNVTERRSFLSPHVAMAMSMSHHHWMMMDRNWDGNRNLDHFGLFTLAIMMIIHSMLNNDVVTLLVTAAYFDDQSREYDQVEDQCFGTHSSLSDIIL